MLLEFRVQNFRSLRDSQALSLVASGDSTSAATHLADTGLKALPRAVRSAAIFGPNASGKTNLVYALGFMRAVVAESATVIQPGQTYNVAPFKLDAASAAEPTTFEVTFVLAGVRHQYGFSMTPQRIVDEWLLVYRSAKPQQWLMRQHDAKTGQTSYEFSTHLTGPRKTWQEATRDNALFLSTAVQLNSELLRPIFKWITESIVFFGAGQTPAEQYTTNLVSDPAGRDAVRNLMGAADFGISDVEAVQRKGLHQQIVLNPVIGAPTHIIREERETLVPQFVHKTATGSARFEYQEESQGTQHWYAMAAPILDVLREGRVLIVDELDGSLHPLLVRKLVDMFHAQSANLQAAQLIFTTHDTSLLEGDLLRRDQVWFTEKGNDQSTKLYPLTDFGPRKKEALARGYLAGRYGAIPFLSEFPLPLAGGSASAGASR